MAQQQSTGKQILGAAEIKRSLFRIAHEIVERNRGVDRLVLLGIPTGGVPLARRLSAAGLREIPGGSLYPALTRLERRGLVTTAIRPSTSGPARKYYELTSAGRAELAGRREEWRAFRAAFSAVLEGAAMSAEVNA